MVRFLKTYSILLTLALMVNGCSQNEIVSDGSLKIELYDQITREKIDASITLVLHNVDTDQQFIQVVEGGEASFSDQRVGLYSIDVNSNSDYEGTTINEFVLLPNEVNMISAFLQPVVLPDIGSLSGFILNDATDEVISDSVQVLLKNEDGSVRDSLVTVNGQYAFTQLPLNAYVITVNDLCGYDSFNSSMLAISKNDDLISNIKLKPTRRFLSQVILNDYPTNKGGDQTWDLLENNPEIFFTLDPDNLAGNSFSNVSKVDLPLGWQFPQPLLASDVNWQFVFWDEDLDLHDKMFEFTINPLTGTGIDCNNDNTLSVIISGAGYDVELIFTTL